jgi:hypothetical protein
VFACSACADGWARAAALVRALRSLVPPVVSAEQLDRLLRAGVRIRATDVPPSRSVTVAFSPGVDLLIHRLHGDLSRAERVDCEVLDGRGTRLLACEHVPFDREHGEVLIACQRHYVSQYAPDIRFRISAVDAEGRRTSRDYEVFHDAERA